MAVPGKTSDEIKSIDGGSVEEKENKLQSLFTWRSAIASNGGPPNSTVRHILLTLGLHMNEKGGSCFPSIKTVSIETGLSERCVCSKLKDAEKDGWIIKSVRGMGGQEWKRHQYAAQIPPSYYDAIENKIKGKGTEQESIPSKNSSKNPLETNDCTINSQGTEQGSTACGKLDQGTEPDVKGTEPNSKKALNEGQSSTSINTTELNYQEPVDNFSNTKDKTIDKTLELKTADQWADWFINEKGFTENSVRAVSVMRIMHLLEDSKVPLSVVKIAIKKANAKLGKQPDTPNYYKNFIATEFTEFKKIYRPPPKPAQWYDDDEAVHREGQARGMIYEPGAEFWKYKDDVIKAVESEKLQSTGK